MRGEELLKAPGFPCIHECWFRVNKDVSSQLRLRACGCGAYYLGSNEDGEQCIKLLVHSWECFSKVVPPFENDDTINVLIKGVVDEEGRDWDDIGDFAGFLDFFVLADKWKISCDYLVLLCGCVDRQNFVKYAGSFH